mmetsp:Transcript_97029/g.244656  ORF Transcript_97029/g.244656 Transcript_97029/m.244656 type:complete len:452 (-) Transcript_97029:90-1445(-)
MVAALDGEAPPPPIDFRGLEILAPMVRAGTLPLRSLSLRYGADLVFGEEIVDRKIIGAVRVENPAFGTIDYVSPRERVAVFSTRPEEKPRLIFQLGTADASLASEAALTVCRDVRGFDVNMGCPKSFSVKGGMGAALLSRPEVASDILKTLRRNLPASCSLTCKIRMLATTEKTRDFMRVCEASGAEAITVHMRTRDERPAEPAHWDEIVRLWDAVKVPVVANGDFFTRRQIDEFWKHCRGSIQQPDVSEAIGEEATRQAGPVAVMVARGALWNPSIFCRACEPPSFEEMVRSFAHEAVRANASYQNTKWVLSQMLAGGIGITPPTTFAGSPMKAFNRQVGAAKSMTGICELLGVPYTASDWPEQAHTTQFYRTGSVGAKAFEAAAGNAVAAAEAPEASGDCAEPAAEATNPTVDRGGDEKRPRPLAIDGAEDTGAAAAKRAKVDSADEAA